MKIEIKIVETEEELQKTFDIRRKTFCGEQGIPEDEEFDKYDHDPTVEHVLLSEDGVAIGCARILPIDGKLKIERISLLIEYRGKGYGKALVAWLADYCKAKNPEEIYINAQYYLEGFYEHLGFEKSGEPFEEGGVKHIKMIFKK